MSHNQRMESLREPIALETPKLLPKPKNQENVTISGREAAEYCAYKRQKKRAAIAAAISRAVYTWDGKEDLHQVCEYALRLRLASVRVTPLQLVECAERFSRRGVSSDCVIGGDGETATRVKVCEARFALRAQARSLTVRIAPSLVENARYADIKKEIRALRRVARKRILKAAATGGSVAQLTRLARVCAEAGADYFSLPYFVGCERLRAELCGGCKLEIVGEFTLDEYKKLISGGADRIVTNAVVGIERAWSREADAYTLESLFAQTQK